MFSRFSHRAQRHQLERQITALEGALEAEMEDTEALQVALLASEQTVTDLQDERFAERALVFDLLDHLAAVVVRCQ